MRHQIIGMLGLSIVALAAPDANGEGWYGALGGDYNSPQDVTARGPASSTEIAQSNGWAVAGAVGYDFQPVRLEGEVHYGRNNIFSLTSSAVGAAQDGSGDVSTFSFLANGYVDFNGGGTWNPYFGAGVGFSSVGANAVTAPGLAVIDDNAGALAYQFTAGIGVSLSKSINLATEYRYFGTDSLELNDTTGASHDVDGAKVHSIGLRLRFRSE